MVTIPDAPHVAADAALLGPVTAKACILARLKNRRKSNGVAISSWDVLYATLHISPIAAEKI
jgi:hypothetical protein